MLVMLIVDIVKTVWLMAIRNWTENGGDLRLTLEASERLKFGLCPIVG